MQYKSTIGADFLTKELVLDNTVVQLQVKKNNILYKNIKKIYSYGIQQDKKSFMQWELHFIVIQNVVF
jgi:hypothetical protein